MRTEAVSGAQLPRRRHEPRPVYCCSAQEIDLTGCAFATPVLRIGTQSVQGHLHRQVAMPATDGPSAISCRTWNRCRAGPQVLRSRQFARGIRSSAQAEQRTCDAMAASVGPHSKICHPHKGQPKATRYSSIRTAWSIDRTSSSGSRTDLALPLRGLCRWQEWPSPVQVCPLAKFLFGSSRFASCGTSLHRHWPS